ncbi:hypothetical protein [Pedococcus bigeumensis]|uniref:hypothetical protein n=1 Tax=Pedococcus bigeumensis TaxID=433644 RepID=UPI002FE8F470
MTTPRPVATPWKPAQPWPSRLVRLATRALPPGEVRDRYRQEFLAELAGLPGPDQTRHAAGILTHSLALRSAVRGTRAGPMEDAMTAPSKPLLCRTNAHHHWEWASTPDGQRYIRCARCLKEKDSGAGGQWTGGASMGSFGQGGG